MNVKYIGNHDLIITQTLKNEIKPLLVYGFGDIGKAVIKKLAHLGIEVSGVLLDDIYFQVNEDAVPKMYPISAVRDKFDKINIVSGFSDYDKIIRMNELDFVNDVFLISNPFLEGEDISWDFYQSHKDNFENAYEMLADDRSKGIFEAYLNTRINNDARYLLGMGSKDSFFNNDIIQLHANMIHVDAGAYNGDTLGSFIDAVGGQYNKIHAFEPDESNYSALSEFISKNDLKNVVAYNEGLWNSKCSITFSGNKEQESFICEGEHCVSVDRLDDLVSRDDRVDLLKLNILGSELEAIAGASRIIADDKPILIVGIFAKRDFLFSILELIESITSGYTYFLRCEDSFFAKVFLYAVPDE